MVKKGEFVEFAKNLEVIDYDPKDGLPTIPLYSTEMSIIIELTKEFRLLQAEVETLKNRITELEK